MTAKRKTKVEGRKEKSCDFGHKEKASWMLAMMGMTAKSPSNFYDVCDNCKKKVLETISSLESKSKKNNGNQKKGNG